MSVLKVKQSDGTWEQVFGGGGSASADITVNNKAADDNGNITLEKSDVGIYTSSTEPTEAKDGDIWINSEDNEAIKILESGSWVSLGGASNTLVVTSDSQYVSHTPTEIKAAYDSGKVVMLLVNDEYSDRIPLYFLDSVTEQSAEFLRIHMDTQNIYHDCVVVFSNGYPSYGSDVVPRLPEIPSDSSDCVLTATNGSLSWKETSGSGGGTGGSIPAYTEADNGKFLRIVEGAPAWVELTDVSEVGA